MSVRGLLLALALLGLTGCYTVDGTIAADGSGELTVRYYLRRHALTADETRRFSSEHVHVVSLQGIGNRQGEAHVRFDDITRISSAEGLRDVEVTRTRAGAEEELHVVIRNPLTPPQRAVLARRAHEAPEQPGPRITLALPGRVTSANRGAAVEDSRVVWAVSLADYADADTLDLVVRWAAS